MKTRRFCVILLLLWAWGAATLPVARADDVPRYTLDQAVALVRDSHGGRVLQATSRRTGDRLLYRVRVLTDDGHVRTFVVDADTGEVE